MLVMVAGGAGFLGASLVDRLQAEGDEVIVIDDLSHGHLANLSEARRRGGIRFHRMDVGQGGLSTLAGRIRADAWVHLAMTADPVRAWSTPSADARAVVAGTVEILEAARETGGARVVVASSGAYLFPAQLTGLSKPDDRPAPFQRLAVRGRRGRRARPGGALEGDRTAPRRHGDRHASARRGGAPRRAHRLERRAGVGTGPPGRPAPLGP